MAVVTSDLVLCSSASTPDADGATTGGAIAAGKRVTFADMTTAGTVNYVSSSASDTAVNITATGRDSAGIVQAETRTLTGVTAVTGGQSFERLMKSIVASGVPVGDVAVISNTAVVTGTAQAGAALTATTPPTITLATGQGASVALGQVLRITNNLPAGVQNQLRQIITISGDVITVDRDWGTVPSSATTYGVHRGMLFPKTPVAVTEVRRAFYDVSSDAPGGATRVFYEKVFFANWNTVTALTGAAILKQTDPSAGTLDFALTTALNDTGTVANRQTVPASGIGAFSSGAAPQTIAVPSPGNLVNGAAPNAANAQGAWLRLTLTAGTVAAKTSFVMRGTGTTT